MTFVYDLMIDALHISAMSVVFLSGPSSNQEAPDEFKE